MAIIKKKVLGQFTGTIADIIGSSWKGKSVVRSKPVSVANPRSDIQSTSRRQFKALALMGRDALSGFIKPLWDRGSKGMSGYNRFIQTNIALFDANEDLPHADMVASRGIMLPPEIDLVSSVAPGILQVEINQVNDPKGTASDQLYALVLDATTSEVLFAGNTGQVRQSAHLGATTLNIKNTSGVSVFLAWRSADGRLTSNSAQANQGTGNHKVTGKEIQIPAKK